VHLRASALAALGLALTTVVGLGAGAPASATTSTNVGGTTPAQGPASSAKLLVAAALNAAKEAGSVHFVEKASAGKQSVSVVGDVSPSNGRQTITVRYGSSVGHMDGLWSNGEVYFKGDSYGLQSFLDFSASLAHKYRNRWIAFTKSYQGFAQTAKQFTVNGPLSEISLTGSLSIVGKDVVDGVMSECVRGRTMALSSNGGSGTGTLYVANNGSLLPIRFVGTGRQPAGAANAWVDFSNWGETVSVQSPTGAIDASTVG
jgi:hypothetical protein